MFLTKSKENNQSKIAKALKGKVVLITGGSKNLGAAMAKGLANEGASIALHYHSDGSRTAANRVISNLRASYSEAVFNSYQADLTVVGKVNKLFEDTIEDFGKVDIVINNAGAIVKKPFVEVSEQDFDLLFDVNTKASFFTMQSAAKHLEDKGRIINIGTSLLAAFTGHYSIYAGSKAPLEDFTRALAKEIGHRGITVNTIAPGPLATEFLYKGETDETLAWLSGASVLGRLGELDDIVPFVKFLSLKESGWMTGQTLFVNGGFTTR